MVQDLPSPFLQMEHSMYEQGDGYRMDQAGCSDVWLAKADGWTRALAERVEELLVRAYTVGHALGWDAHAREKEL